MSSTNFGLVSTALLGWMGCGRWFFNTAFLLDGFRAQRPGQYQFLDSVLFPTQVRSYLIDLTQT